MMPTTESPFAVIKLKNYFTKNNGNLKLKWVDYLLRPGLFAAPEFESVLSATGVVLV